MENWTAQVTNHNSPFHFGSVCHIMMIALLTLTINDLENYSSMTDREQANLSLVFFAKQYK